MDLRRGLWLLTGLPLAAGCGERAGDPVVTLPATASPSSGAAGSPGAGLTTGAAAGGAPGYVAPGSGGVGGELDGSAGESSPTRGVTGLCGACRESKDCGDRDDLCLLREGVRFCGRDCEEGNGCPDGYACSDILNTSIHQCVPTASSCAEPRAPAPSLDVLREYLLARINAERFARARAALKLSDCLNGLAQDSALELASTGQALAKYTRECEPLWPACECGWTAQAETTLAGWGLDWESAIDRALGSYRAQADDPFVDSFLEFQVTQIGIGFWLSGDEAWIALSFS